MNLLVSLPRIRTKLHFLFFFRYVNRHTDQYDCKLRTRITSQIKQVPFLSSSLNTKGRRGAFYAVFMLPVLPLPEPTYSARQRQTVCRASFRQPTSIEDEAAPPLSFVVTSSHVSSVPPLLPSLEACTSVQDLLTLFSTAPITSFDDFKKPSLQLNAASQDVKRSGLLTGWHSSASLPAPATWDSHAMVQARKRVAACVTDAFARNTASEHSRDTVDDSIERFFLFLVTGEQDVLRTVRQQHRPKPKPKLCACQAPALPQTAAAAAVAAVTRTTQERTSETEQHANSSHDAALEKEALAFLMRCTSFLVLRQRQGTEVAQEYAGDDGAAAASSGCIRRGWRACSALALLRSSASATPVCCDAPYWCSTGCDGLDRALGGGGLRSGWVTEIYGEAGAGKTQLGLQCLLEQSARDVCQSAVALCLAHDPSFLALLRQSEGGVAQRCANVFGVDRVEAARCAVVYLVSEDVPTSRLGPLATAAVRRAVRGVQLHSLVAQLPSAVVEAVLCSVRQTCTVTTVLCRVQIRRLASLQEVVRLLEPAAAASREVDHSISAARLRGHCSLSEAVHLVGGSGGRALIVLDSIAAAAVAGLSDMHGVAQADASVAAVATQLRRAAIQHNWCVVVMNQVRAVPSAVKSAVQGRSFARAKRVRSPHAASSAPSSSAPGGSYAMVPALGLAWSGVAQCRVYLRKLSSSGVRQLILRQSPAHPPYQVSYVITQNGIEDA